MTHSTKPAAKPKPPLPLKPNGAVCNVELPLRPLRIYFQSYPGMTGTDANRALAGVPYKLRIPGQPEINGQTEPNGQILLPGLTPGMIGELEIFGTLIRLSPRDFSEKEVTDGRTEMNIEGAKRRLMLLGYYDKPYRTASLTRYSAADKQVPNDRLDSPEAEDAILHFQTDSNFLPNGEIERHELDKKMGWVDPSQKYGFHTDLASSTVKKFHPDFVAKLAAGGASAPPGTMTRCEVAPPMTLRSKTAESPYSPPLEREIYEGHRFVPVRFTRLGSGKFEPLKPELDERGYADGRFGPVVSVMSGERIEVRLERLHVSSSAPLFLKSTDESVVTVQTSGDTVRLTGVTGAGKNVPPKKATIEVRYGGATGPVLRRLYVEVYDPIEVGVVVHFMSIGERGKPEVPRVAPPIHQAQLVPVFEKINSIWRAAGIRFEVVQWVNDTIDLAQAGAMQQGEFYEVTRKNSVPNRLNMYVVPAMVSGGIGFGYPEKGLVAADRMQGGATSTDEQLLQTFAHEIGHFLGLWHPATFNPKGDEVVVKLPDRAEENHALEDYWSRRMLMYCYTGLNRTDVELTGTLRQRGRQSDVGNDWYVGGKMLCCRVVPQIVSSKRASEIQTAREIALLNRVTSPHTETAWSKYFDNNSGQGVFA